MSKYARANLFVGGYNIPEDGHIRLGDDARVVYLRGREKSSGWEEDPNGALWMMVEDGGFWPVMIEMGERDERIVSPGRPGRLAGQTVRWTTTRTPEGIALIAATRRGLCAVRLGSDADSLTVGLKASFPDAAIFRDDKSLGSLSLLVSDLAAGGDRPDAADVALDIAGTAFQAKVWAYVRGIPRGQTRTYAQIATELGNPRAVRAVGAACAINPVVLVVPCHRVVGADGALGGYAYGPDIKRRLLAGELLSTPVRRRA